MPLLLVQHEVRLRSSTVQVLIEDAPASGADVELTVFDDLMDGVGESARVALPAAVAELTAEQQWWLAFDVVRCTCEQLASVAGQLPGPWRLLAAEMLARGPAERRVSAWKTAPDRRHRARLVTEVRVDRPIQTWIEIARRGEVESVGRGPGVPAGTSRHRLEPPRWRGAQTAGVTILIDRGGFGLHREELTADIRDLKPVEPLKVIRPMAEPQVPITKVAHFSTSDPARPADVAIAEINGEPWRLPDEHRRAWTAIGQARLPELKQWWAASGLATLIVSAVCVPEAPRASSFIDGRDLYVEVPLHPEVVPHVDPEQAALDALQAAVRAAAKRAKMTPLTLS